MKSKGHSRSLITAQFNRPHMTFHQCYTELSKVFLGIAIFITMLYIYSVWLNIQNYKNKV